MPSFPVVPMDEDERERPDLSTSGGEEVGDDREGPDPLTPGGEEVDDFDREADLDVPSRDVGPGEDSETTREARKRSEQHNWRRWAWWALIITTVGVGWALVLATIFVVRSGDRTAELISLFESGQQGRQVTAGDAQQNSKERQAALEAQRQETQTSHAQELAALADQSQSNAEARLALANAAFAESRIAQADSEANKANAEAALAQRQTDVKDTREGRGQGSALATLSAAIEALRDAVDDAEKRRPELCTEPDEGEDDGCATGGTAASPGP